MAQTISWQERGRGQRRRATHAALLAALLIGVLTALTPWSAAGTKAAQSRPVLVVFVPGFTLSRQAWADQPREFHTISDRLAQSIGSIEVTQYSYDGGTRPYRPADTVRRSIEADAAVLDTYVRAASHADIYLIGYSLGGVVAAYYAAAYPAHDAAAGTRIAGVITLDSPVHGFRPTMPCLGSGMGGWVSKFEFAMNKWLVLPELQPNSAVIARIANLPRAVPTLTIASQDDCLVTPAQALLPGAQQVLTHSGHAADIVASHGAVLRDSAAVSAIARFISAQAAASP